MIRATLRRQRPLEDVKIEARAVVEMHVPVEQPAARKRLVRYRCFRWPTPM